MTADDGGTTSGYSPTPRPTFDGPTVIRFDDAVVATWGDDVSGRVHDRIFVSSSKIHHLVFELAPHAAFTHSEAYRTVFAAHESLLVLSGMLALANPQTGEVVRAAPGESIVFGPDTWHHGFNESAEQLRVLEFFAPPPSTGTSGAYAQTKPMLEKSVYTRDDLLAEWPPIAPSIDRATLRVVRDTDLLWRLEGDEHRTLCGIVASSKDLTAGKLFLPPGRGTDHRSHGGDLAAMIVEGSVSVELLSSEDTQNADLGTLDGFYVTEGARYRLENRSAHPAVVAFGVGLRYRA